MSLSRHILPEDVVDAHKDKNKAHRHPFAHKSTHHQSAYAGRYQSQHDIPKFSLPETGIAPKQAYQLIHDETTLDGNPALNLASFVHTWMPDEGVKLMEENMFVNLADQDEYPSTTLIHNRCVSMIADLWNVPKGNKAIGSATTGSSEAILLGGLALKKRWQAKRKAEGKSIHEPGPNIILGAEAHCSLEKFTRYFDVEARLVPVTVESGYVMDPKEALKRVDENTIGIYIIMGSTYTGHFENVKELSDLLDAHQEQTGIDIPIHVDAASGGFFAPFVYPERLWDFRLPRVHSINASGHKFGMSVVGVGWIIWKDESFLPKELIFELHYLGSTEYSFTLNFSRPAHPILGQYFTFQLGFKGYKEVMTNDLTLARYLSNALENSGHFKVLSDVHRRIDGGKSMVGQAKEAVGAEDVDDPLLYHQGLPVVSFRFTDEFKKQYPDVKQEWVQKLLRFNGWIVPNYALAPNCQDTEILRVVVRESLTADMTQRLVEDIVSVTESLIEQEAPFVANVKAVRGGEADEGAAQARNGHVERVLGSANQDNKREHQGTYAKQC